MGQTITYKPIGGVESVALYPPDAVRSVLFATNGCMVIFSGQAVELPLLEDRSYYEEVSKYDEGARCVSHTLHLVAAPDSAAMCLTEEFLEQAYFEGFVAKILLCDGRCLFAGYSAHLQDEQPLRLESVTTSSGSEVRQTPTVTLRLHSCDTEFSQRML